MWISYRLCTNSLPSSSKYGQIYKSPWIYSCNYKIRSRRIQLKPWGHKYGQIYKCSSRWFLPLSQPVRSQPVPSSVALPVMEKTQSSIKILETNQVSPQKPAIHNSFHLTCFDLIWIKFPPTERLFFYEFKASSTDETLNRLKHSLSLALSYYHPLAGHLTWTKNDSKPFIQCTSTDSVSLVVAESTADFEKLSSKGNIIKALELRNYAPSLHTSEESASIVSFQITFFPGCGFCIGIAAHHAILDARSTTMFMKSWAYLCQKIYQENEKCPILPPHLAPYSDRTVIKDPTGNLDMFYLDSWLNIAAKMNPGTNPRSLKVKEMGTVSEDLVRATFDLSREDISKIKEKIISKLDDYKDFHLSSFALTYAHAIVCFVKAKAIEGNAYVNSTFAADFRSRLVPPLPTNYFGNCIGSDKVRTVEAKDVVGEEGLLKVVKNISDSIKNLEKYEYFERAVEVFNSYSTALCSPLGIIGVAGSPKLEIYGVDFGCGKPKKVDIVSIDRGPSFSMAESRDKSGGIEIGLSFFHLLLPPSRRRITSTTLTKQSDIPPPLSPPPIPAPSDLNTRAGVLSRWTAWITADVQPESTTGDSGVVVSGSASSMVCVV
ncbi:hypothetical protein ACFE04_007783 [Oxalis oulophora]